jgi:hypothetical protein
MEPLEQDVYVSYRRSAGEDLARLVAAGLTKRGFRVQVGSRDSAGGIAGNLAAIENAPDFVVLLTPGALDPAIEDDETRIEVAHALEHERNIVPVIVPPFARPRAGASPADLAAFPWRDAVAYDPLASHESVARIAHMLASDTSVDERRLELQAKRIFVTLGVALLAVAAIEVARALPRMLARPFEPPPLPPLSLCWSGFGQRSESGRWIEFALEDGSQLFAGDQIKLAFGVTADAHAYVVAKDLRGDLSVLFPARSLKANAQVRGSEVYEAPFDGSWLNVVDPAGIQAIYLLASYDPIENLEAMVEERDEESTIQGRQFLLDSTIAGLLDGRHNLAASAIRTRRGRAIVQNLVATPGPRTAQAALTGGLLVTHPLVTQPGLLSAVAEIKLRYER